jgi:hypothetical protein
MKRVYLFFSLGFLIPTLFSHAQESDPHAVFPPDRSTGSTFQSFSDNPLFLNLPLSGNSAPQNEPSIRIGRTNSNVIVAAWRDFRLGYTNPIIRRIGYTYSLDGGATWAPSQLLPDPGPTYVSQSDPVLTSDAQGNFYLSSTSRKQDNSPQERDQIVYKSTNSGESFFFRGVAIVSAGGGGEDKEWMTCDPVPTNSTYNNLMVTSTNTLNGIIRFAKSSDGGLNWSSPVNISDASGGTGSNIVVGTDGIIHVVWSQGGVRYDRSTNAGSSFGTDVQIRTSTLNGFPFICADYSNRSTRGNLYEVWSDNSAGTYDVWFQRSTNSGTTWLAAATRVNDVVTNSQWWPAVQCDTNGVISVVYYDNRSGTSVWNSYYAYSTDAGNTWTNARLSDVSFFGNQPNSDVRYGDYIGVDAFSSKVFPVWTDDRAGGADQEIYAGVVSLPLGVGNVSPDLPFEFQLYQNYPNPFNPTTTIAYTLPSQSVRRAEGRVGVGSHVTLKVYDLLGREVATLVNEELKPGSYMRTFNAANLASGVYLYRLQSEGTSIIKKMILMR